MGNTFNLPAAIGCLQEAEALIASGTIEDVLRQRFAAYLPQIFPEQPWWVNYHGLGSEAHVKFDKDGKASGGFVDSLIGLTAIEYEKDIRNPAIFRHGLAQVQDYCAGLLNKGHAPDLIVGVLSDTVRWRAYRVAEVTSLDAMGSGIYGRSNVILEEIESLDVTLADERQARRLIDFLVRHLGREGARPLGAETIARDLGFSSGFGDRHLYGLNALVNEAFSSNPKYSALIEKLWRDFIAYLGENNSKIGFDKDVYVRELYLLTLAKILCANVIERGALSSNEVELRSILNGDYFRMKGLSNLVEYDYFGWLNDDPHVTALLPVAADIQDDLRAYDFRSPPVEDLFGAMMAQLAKRSQRLLLGQEWTPAWLAEGVVKRAFELLPEGEDPQFVDMCCGSGAMVVETVKLAKAKLDGTNAEHDAAYVSRLAHSISGFDIDPLAVMLSKVGWVIAARDRLEPFGMFQVSIPVYHADSLFVGTSLSRRIDEDAGTDRYELVLDDRKVNLPAFLVSPEHRSLFDALLNVCYASAMRTAETPGLGFSDDDISLLIEESEKNAGLSLSHEGREETTHFCAELVHALITLQRDGRNGVWAFVLRNSYRPALVAGLFNGLVSNPPWLALSKIADNPYKDALRRKAENYGIKPPGPSHLHIELATIFLLHAAESYLKPGGVFGCVLPETILSGHHHNPFRVGAFRSVVPLAVDELWRVEAGTFKNEAVVLFGKKVNRSSFAPNAIAGRSVSASSREDVIFSEIVQGNRVAWSERGNIGAGGFGFFQPAEFRQGADIMPRTLIFHETRRVSATQWSIGPIDRSGSASRYLVGDAKKHKEFALPTCVVDDRFIFDVLMSNHLTPFDIAEPAKAFLPIEQGASGKWAPISATRLAVHGSSKPAFDRILATASKDLPGFFDMLDSNRRKLTSQEIPVGGWLVFMGAGGDYVCASYMSATIYGAGKLIVDQTLYWAAVETEDEAIYLVGLLNSEAVNDVIKEFQPRGQFGARHVHTLPLGVTPPFDIDDASHEDVVLRTRQLLSDWSIAKTNPEISGLLDPNKSLAQRRRKLRLTIQSLPSYAAYELATRNLYGL
jgi:hypothetical protein